MSKNEKNAVEKEEKVMTKYDLKMQKRREAKEKEKKQKQRDRLIGVVVVLVLICFIAYFPIRTYLAVNGTYVKVNGEDISKVEFEYHYNIIKNNFLTEYSDYLAYFGLDTTTDLSTQMYSDTLSWEDYFEQQAMDSLVQVKALAQQAEIEGFSCNVDKAYETYKAGLEATADAMGNTVSEYVKQFYGPQATVERIEKFVRESLYLNEFYSYMQDKLTPSDDEIQNYYEENKSSFDSVDYYVTSINAELPTEPTELADPVDTTEESTTEESEEYKPSEAEIEKAMADAKVLAEEALATVTTDGELEENVKYSGASSYIRDWLFDESRKEGDATVIENTTGNMYYVVSFVKRYQDDSLSADARIILAPNGDGQVILDEWKGGEATEESFGTLADKYNVGSGLTAEGGLYEKILHGQLQTEIEEWVFEEGRAAGDTAVITAGEDGNTFVVYYVGTNDPVWKIGVSSTILTSEMESYLQEIVEDIEIEDPKGNLEYLKVAEEETAESENSETTEGTDSE